MITKEKLLKCLTVESFFIYESLAADNIGTIELTSLDILIDFAKNIVLIHFSITIHMQMRLIY